jgi:predicted metal-binding protein
MIIIRAKHLISVSLEHMKEQNLLNLIKTRPFNAVRSFSTGTLVFSEEVRAMCKMNRCGRYGRCWNCPPAAGHFDMLSKMCRSYPDGVLFSKVSAIEDSFDWAGMMRAGAEMNDEILALNRLLPHMALRRYRLFGSGGCHHCETCTYPHAPCIYPDRLFLPIEACGIDVMALSATIGIKYGNGENTVTFFGMLLYESAATEVLQGNL